MKGLEISRLYYESHGREELKRAFPDIWDKIAVGLVGEGSECFGFDDEISRDHDFGPDFCIWVPKDIYLTHGEKLEAFYDTLPNEFMGFKKQSSQNGIRRSGVFSTEDFYKRFFKYFPYPQSNKEWLMICEESLATATNGAVFKEDHGDFCKIRERLLNFYPRDAVKKKLSANIAIMAQSGQYNYVRSIKRSDKASAYFSKYIFIDSAFKALFLLAGVYMPFYKWKARMLKENTAYPSELIHDLEELMEKDDPGTIERICLYIRDILIFKGWVNGRSSFLHNTAVELQKSIDDPELRRMDLLYGGTLK